MRLSRLLRRSIRLLLWGAILLALDRSFVVFRFPGDSLFMQITLAKAARACDYLEQNPDVPEVVILGSSHALFGIRPGALFETEAEADRAYNFGAGTLSIEQQRRLFEELLERGTPQRLILALDFFTLNQPLNQGEAVVDEILGRARIRRLELEEVRELELPLKEQTGIAACVARSAQRLAVGCSKAGGAGVVEVFERKDGRWERGSVPLPDDLSPGDFFGNAVAMDERTLVVGAWRGDRSGPDTGSVYVYRREGESWMLETCLAPSDGGRADAFGCAVAVDGDRILVGARQHDARGKNSGAAYLYRRAADGWALEHKLVPSQAKRKEQFGTSVDIEGGLAVVGAPKSEGEGPRSGIVYVYRENDGGWAEEAMLRGGGPTEELGTNLDLSGGGLLVTGKRTRRALLYRETDAGWAEEAEFIGLPRGFLSGPAVLEGDTVVIAGALGPGEFGLYVYGFVPELGWRRQGQFVPDEESTLRGALQVALSGRSLLVGAPAHVGNRVVVGRLPEPAALSEVRLTWQERVSLSSYAYRYREDTKRYLAGLVDGEWTLPYRRGDEERDEDVFRWMDGATVDDWGHAGGRGEANPDHVRREGFVFRTQEGAREALDAIVASARERGVKVDIVQLPEHAACHAEAGRYDVFESYMRELVSELAVSYHDFNRAEAFPLEQTELFFDTDHLNSDGAELLSRELGIRLGLRAGD